MTKYDLSQAVEAIHKSSGPQIFESWIPLVINPCCFLPSCSFMPLVCPVKALALTSCLV